MISENMVEGLSYQINREIYSGYFYLGMAAYATSIGLRGVANWFSVQFKEELSHAEKMFNYVNQQGAKVTLQAIEEPPQDFSSAIDLFRRTLEHEKKVTKMINDLLDLAKSENDAGTEKFLEWFVKEQAEEEATPAAILEKFKSVEKNREGVAKIDGELAKRK